MLLLLFLLLFTHHVKATVRPSVWYDRDTLFSLQEQSHWGTLDHTALDLHPELLHQNNVQQVYSGSQTQARAYTGFNRPKRKRGRRGGTERKLRGLVSKGRLTLPVILFANVQSLGNKMDELHARLSAERYLRNCSLLCFCETWLGEEIPDEPLTPEGYTIFRADRRAADCGKSRGGGTAVLVNQSWCTDNKVISQHCSEDVEFLTLKCMPFYLPRELHCIIVSVVYIPPLC